MTATATNATSTTTTAAAAAAMDDHCSPASIDGPLSSKTDSSSIGASPKVIPVLPPINTQPHSRSESDLANHLDRHKVSTLLSRVSLLTPSSPAPGPPMDGFTLRSAGVSLQGIGYGLSVDDILMTRRDILDYPAYSDEERTHRLESMYIRAASNGDIGRLQECLATEAADWINLDAADEDGTTALISAACFGHVDVVRILLDAGASIDSCDKKTATILIEAGANKLAKSTRGRSIVDLSTKNGNNDIVRILDPELAMRRERKAARLSAKAARALESKLGSPLVDGKKAIKLDLGNADSEASPLPIDSDDDDELYDQNDSSLETSDEDDYELALMGPTFQWDACRPDQMFVFEEAHMDHVLDIIVRRIRPTRGPDYVPVGANIIFLCARYAHYWNSNSMLVSFLNLSIEKIVLVLKACPDDIHFYSYWLSNTMQLLVYLKRDTGLLVTTFDAQCLLCELVEEIYQQLVTSIQRSISSLIDPAIIEYRKLHALSRVRYEPVFFGIGRRRSLLKLNQEYTPPRSPRSAQSTRSLSFMPQYEVTPASINSILGSTLNVMKSCKVHEQVVHQLFHQLLHFLNAEMFNRIVTTSDLCSRARAHQIQLNIAMVQNWVRENAATLPQITGPAASYGRNNALVQHLRPSMQLTQFLHVATTCGADLGGFLELVGSMDMLSTAQCHKAMQNYRYEVGEASFPSDVEGYVQKLIDELTVDKKSGTPSHPLQRQQSRRRRLSIESNSDPTLPSHDPSKSSSVLSPPDTGPTDTTLDTFPENDTTTNSATTSAGRNSYDSDMGGLDDALNPLLDSRFVLPFSVPIPGRDDLLWSFMPSIPAQVMDMMGDITSLDTADKPGMEVARTAAATVGGLHHLYQPASLASFSPLAATASSFLTPIFNSVRFSSS
ncbi:hypothetical protein BASA61_004788 [Batrachochytrium salamandrivorans]|nr:hypothetical protein BASA61_004788 [Batrachochytrium salamandrivorans]